MFLTLGCVTAAINSAFKSVFPSSTTGTASVLVLGIGSGMDAAEPIDVALGPTAVLFSPLPLADPAKQKQLKNEFHPACFACRLSCGVICVLLLYLACLYIISWFACHHALHVLHAFLYAVKKSCLSRAVQAAVT